MFSSGSAIFMSVVTLPSHTPDRVFSLSNDFCASDCANACTDKNVKIGNRLRRLHFMVLSPQGLFDITITPYHMQAFFFGSERARRETLRRPTDIAVVPAKSQSGCDRR